MMMGKIVLSLSKSSPPKESSYVRLSDFGLSAIIKKSRCHSLSGTGTYLAPEVIEDPNNEGHGSSVDWWALGILTYILLTLQCPFYSENTKDLFIMICKEEISWEELKAQHSLSPTALAFLQGVR